LGLLAKLQTDLIKLDMGLIRGIEGCRARRAIVSGVLGIASSLSIDVVAEGVETREELGALQQIGIRYVQGYLLGRPTWFLN
jgi:EAL domain-containing protein (putative c-di-GMP-specific phosphodiesterase class I)